MKCKALEVEEHDQTQQTRRNKEGSVRKTVKNVKKRKIKPKSESRESHDILAQHTEVDDSENTEKESPVIISCEPLDDTVEEDSVKRNTAIPASQVGEVVGGFTVLPDTTRIQDVNVKRKLPDWLAKPDMINPSINEDKKPLSEVNFLSGDLIRRLEDNGITHLFPVQCQLIPAILSSVTMSVPASRGGYPPRDICCSAATGSGKTLAFVLPIVQALKDRVVCHIRAIVVLPVTDLAIQVFNVFQTYAEGTKLKVGLTVGQSALSVEQAAITRRSKQGVRSAIDILVSTPGRLVDHLSFTQGFDLSHLRFLVLDEVDRILEEVKQDWLNQLERAVYYSRLHAGKLNALNSQKVMVPLQKLLFSATLTENPEKLQQLNLCEPHLFTSGERGKQQDGEGERAHIIGKFTTPNGLQEYYTECPSSTLKPLVLLYMLHVMRLRNVLCFAGSQDTVNRLYHLLSLYGGLNVQQFSAAVPKKKRQEIIKQFAVGAFDVIVCTDMVTRGMDLDNVECVISYDAAPYIKTYVHRVGRTARAGRGGTAYTLLNTNQVGYFRHMMKAASKTVRSRKVTRTDLKPLAARYKETLSELPKRVKTV